MANFRFCKVFYIWLFILLPVATIHNPSFAQTNVEKLTRQLDLSSEDTSRVRLLNSLAWEIRFTAPDKAISYAEEAILVSARLNLPKAQSTAYRTRAISLSVTGKKIEAISAYDSAIYLARKAKDPAWEATCLNNKAGIFGDLGDFDKAIEVYSQGLEIAQRINNAKLISTFYNNIADGYQNTGRNPAMVLKYYKLALEYSLKNSNWESAGLNSSNLAKEYSAQGMTKEATQELNRSLDLLKKTPYGTYLYAATSNLIGSVYADLKQYEPAKKYASRSYFILDSLKMPDNTLRPLLVLTNVENIQNNLSRAIEYCDILLKTALKTKAKIYIKEAYRSLSEISKKQGKYESALQYYEQYKRWDDSVFQGEREKNISLIEFKAALARQEMETKYGLSLKEEENRDLVSANNNLRRIIVIALIAVLIFVILGVLLYRSTKKKQFLNLELIQKNAMVQKQAGEKDELIQEIHHRVKNNLTMLQSLFFLQSKSTESSEIKQVLAESQTRLLSMSLVHEHLYENDNEGTLELTGFIENLLHDITETFTHNVHQKITYHVQGGHVEIGIKLAIPAGLLLNELITNSLKYAFSDRESGHIEVVVAELGKDLHIEYYDDGVGLSKPFEMNDAGFGFKILKLLCKQLKATINYSKESGKSSFQLIIPKTGI